MGGGEGLPGGGVMLYRLPQFRQVKHSPKTPFPQAAKWHC